MKISRSLQFLAAVSALALVAACASGRGYRSDGSVDPNYVAVGGAWDSGPLDASYHQERTATDARHNDELANPPAGENHDQTVTRQAAENKDVETRYQQGKDSHAKAMPQAADKSHSDDKPDNKPQQ
jgi:hypothetical protein